LQVNLANKQNTEAQQTQLADLTVTIAQQVAEQSALTSQTGSADTKTATASTNGPSMDELTAQLTVEGQIGAVLIKELKGRGVVGIEYIEAASALEVGGDTPHAIDLYKAALSAPPHDAATRALGMRYLGRLYYAIDRPVLGHQYMMQAAKAFNGHPQYTQFYIHTFIALTYMMDANSQISINGCRIAAAEQKAGEDALRPFPATQPIQASINQYNATYPQHCHSGG
jgi:hypothetical protein